MNSLTLGFGLGFACSLGALVVALFLRGANKSKPVELVYPCCDGCGAIAPDPHAHWCNSGGDHAA